MPESFDSGGDEPNLLPFDSEAEDNRNATPLDDAYDAENPEDLYSSAGILNVDFDTTYRELLNIHGAMVDEIMEARYAADPALRGFASEHADFYTEVIFQGLGGDRQTDPAADTFTKAYTRLFCIFTDPADHTNTLSSALLMAQVGELWRACQAAGGEEPALRQVATILDWASGHMVIVEATLRDTGELGGLNADQRYLATKARLQLLMEPGIQPQGPDSE